MKTERGDSTRRARIGRLVIASVALGAMAAPALALTPAGAQAPVSISTMQTSQGKVLASGGMTLYTLQPSSSPCNAACLKIWPAVFLAPGQAKATAKGGVSASQLGSRSVSGHRQVTYKGKLVYWYSGDTAPGQVNGNFSDLWGKWTAVVPAGASNTGSGNTGNSNAGSGNTGNSNAGSGGASF
jgi:predicted lipoprotein with Yx(FWY)xxD motif